MWVTDGKSVAGPGLDLHRLRRIGNQPDRRTRSPRPGGEGAGILMRSGGTVYGLLVTVHLEPGLKWLHRNE
mgnify:CR=1 FL=1